MFVLWHCCIGIIGRQWAVGRHNSHVGGRDRVSQYKDLAPGWLYRWRETNESFAVGGSEVL
jgi:hypothetical protein